MCTSNTNAGRVVPCRTDEAEFMHGMLAKTKAIIKF